MDITPTKGFSFTSDDVIREVSGYSPRALLAFSTGKDCISAYLAMRGKFEEVQPYYLYQIPGNLEFIEESLAYYERKLFGGRRIIRMPHPFIMRALGDLQFQPPGRAGRIIDWGPATFGADEVGAELALELGWGDNVYTATGVRAADSPARYMSFKKHGAVNHKRKSFAPVFDWRKDRIIQEINKAGVKLPVDYRIFGRTFDGLDLRFMYPLKKHFPRDYQRVLEWFPLVELELFRFEKRAQQ